MTTESANNADHAELGASQSRDAVEAVMDSLEARDINPSIKEVRKEMGGMTASVGKLVTEVNTDREAALESELSDSLMTAAKKGFHAARESAKKIYANQLQTQASELNGLTARLANKTSMVKDLTSKLQAESIARAAADKLLGMEVAAREAAAQAQTAAKEALAVAKLELEHMAFDLATVREEVLVLKRTLQSEQTSSIHLQQRLNDSVDSLQAERVAARSAEKLFKHEAESHQATKASHAEVNANLVAANSDLANSKRELKEVRDENSAIKREQQAAQAQLLQINERVDMLTHTNGILSTQLQLLLNRIRGVCPDIADEFVLDAHQTRKSEAV